MRFTRRLPAAFAIGVERTVTLTLEHRRAHDWACALYDHVDASVAAKGLPHARSCCPAANASRRRYAVTPTRRGEITFAPAELRVRSRLGLCELLRARSAPTEMRRVYPDFAELARYAWLAGDRRLQEIGIKTFQQRGEGTDFKQLAEYRYGDSVRHIDWKATLRLDKPIVREFQDERDQCVMLLIDCGRRMRADDRRGGVGTAHFDQVLNAVMLLSYVALAQGDAVGALTFGTPPGEERLFAPRKGAHTLNALMSELYGVQPTPTPLGLRRRRAGPAAPAEQARARHRHHELPRRGRQRARPGAEAAAPAPPRAARERARAHRRRADRAAAVVAATRRSTSRARISTSKLVATRSAASPRATR